MFHCFTYFIVFLVFLKPQIVSICAKIVFSQNCRDDKNEGFEKKITFFCFCCCKRNSKQNGKETKKPIKIMFLRWSSKSEKNEKNGFLAKIAWHYLCHQGTKNVHFRAHYLYWPKNDFGPKQWKPGKTIKIVVSAEIAQNQKWLFFEKGVFWHGWKSGFTNCVIEELCSSGNTSL